MPVSSIASQFNRRKFIQYTALLGGALLLDACGGATTGTAAPTTSSSSSGSSSTSTTASSSSSSSSSTSTTSSAATNPATPFSSTYSQSFLINPPAAGVKLASDQSLRYMYIEPTHLDPGLATSGTEVYLIYEIWEGLLRFDAQGNVQPLGATNWDVSADGTTYTFHLRDGVKWTDGTPVTAADYVWTWQRNEDPKTASEYAEALYIVKNAKDINAGKIADLTQLGVKAPDPSTFVVTLEGPAGYFLRLASTWTAMPLPKQSVTKFGAKWVQPPNVISNGPFKLTEWTPSQQITLTRNEGYWGTKPTVQTVTIKLVSDPQTTGLTAFENNELDIAIGPWPADFARIKSDPTLSKQLNVLPGSVTAFVVCDTSNTNSPVSKPEVRKALYLALDRTQIVTKVFQGLYKATYTMLPDDILGHNPDARIQGTVQDAQKLLSQAGFPGGKGISLTLPYSQNANNNLLAQVLQQMWQTNLGITVTLNPMETKAFTSLFESFDKTHYDIYFSTWGSDYLDPFDWMNFLFTTGTDFYHAHWSNAQFDQICQQAAVEQDPNKRAQLYSQSETILIGDAAYIPLYHTATPYLFKPWVLNYPYQATGGRPYVYIEIAQH